MHVALREWNRYSLLVEANFYRARDIPEHVPVIVGLCPWPYYKVNR